MSDELKKARQKIEKDYGLEIIRSKEDKKNSKSRFYFYRFFKFR